MKPSIVSATTTADFIASVVVMPNMNTITSNFIIPITKMDDMFEKEFEDGYV